MRTLAEKILQQAIDKDLSLKTKWAKLPTYVLSFDLQPLKKTYYLVLNQTQVFILKSHHGHCDAHASFSPYSACQFLLDTKKHRWTQGDATPFSTRDYKSLEERLSDIDQLSLDWEYIFSQLIGSQATGWLIPFAKSSQKWLTHRQTEIHLQISDFIQYETTWVLGRNEFEAFESDMQGAANHLRHIETRLKEIETRLHHIS